jgi:hypothetical protein
MSDQGAFEVNDGGFFTLGGRPLTPIDLFHLGALVAAVDGCRSVRMDSERGSVELVGVPMFAAAVLAVEHFRRRAEGPA